MRPTCCLVFTANILAPENLEHLLLSTSPKPHPPIPQNQTKHKENTAWIAKIYEQSALPNVFTYSLKNTSKEGYSQGAKPSILSLPLALDNFLVLIKMGGGGRQPGKSRDDEAQTLYWLYAFKKINVWIKIEGVTDYSELYALIMGVQDPAPYLK